MTIDERKERVRAAIKRLGVKDVDGVYVHSLAKFIDGNVSINQKKNRLKITVSLPADEMLFTNDVRAVLQGDWKMFPLLVLIDPDEVGAAGET